MAACHGNATAEEALRQGENLRRRWKMMTWLILSMVFFEENCPIHQEIIPEKEAMVDPICQDLGMVMQNRMMSKYSNYM